MTHSLLANPFGFLFASRYATDDDLEDPQFSRYFDEESPYAMYCLDGTAPKYLVPKHYASVKFKVIKEKRKHDWIIQTTTYEEHYISLSYFSEFMGLSVEDYIDIGAMQSCKMPFKRTNNHPVFDTICLRPSSGNVTYKIEVVDICYYGRINIDGIVSRMIGYNDYMLMSPPLVGIDISMNVQEFDSNLWT
jgi:hypothetical protein